MGLAFFNAARKRAAKEKKKAEDRAKIAARKVSDTKQEGQVKAVGRKPAPSKRDKK